MHLQLQEQVFMQLLAPVLCVNHPPEAFCIQIDFIFSCKAVVAPTQDSSAAASSPTLCVHSSQDV